MSAYSTLAESAAGYWKLNETGGTVAADAIGGNDGTYVNTPTLGQSGLHANTGGAVLFDGVNQRVDLGDVLAYEYTDPFSISAWLQHDVEPVGWQSVVSKYRTSDTSGYTFWAGVSTYYFGIADTVTGNLARTYPRTTGTAARHVCATYDGSNTVAGLQVYEDGVLLTPTPSGVIALTTTMVTTNVLQLGASASATYLKGTLDEVMIFDTELSAANVAILAAPTLISDALSSPINADLELKLSRSCKESQHN